MTEPELVATLTQPALVAETASIEVFAVRWPVLRGVDGEGLLLEPKGKAVADVVALPDADQTPECSSGWPGAEPELDSSPAGWPRPAAGCSCRSLIDRHDPFVGQPARTG